MCLSGVLPGRGNRTPTTSRKTNGRQLILQEMIAGCCGAARGATITTLPVVPPGPPPGAATLGFGWSPPFEMLDAVFLES